MGTTVEPASSIMKVLVVVSAVLAVAAAQYLPFSGYGYSGYPYHAGYFNGAYNYNLATPYTAYTTAPYTTTPYAYGAFPYATHAAPAVASSQYHAQNELGGYNYGYADGLSTKHESKNAYGGTVGSYSYVDSNNKVQTVNYVADHLGFRVSGTNLPVAPTANLEAPVHTAVGPAPVEDTAEVKAAKAEFKKLYDEAAAAAEAAPDSRKKRSLMAPEPVEDTAEVKAAKAEFKKLYDAAAAAADAAPDTDGPAYADYYGYPYAATPYAYGAPLTYAAAPLAYARAPAGFSYGFSSAHYPYARYFY